MRGELSELIHVAMIVLLAALICGGIGSCKKWQYDECLQVGHGKAYCMAESAGCFDAPRKGR
jgi:hypothetical protein